ncbi:hypothetical protein HK100_003998 [Physocladia obscura]|uniref:Membrane-associated protein n=1 Tax=Physocladia obscura TaxID=109957 RepID=A0AAD5XCW2_9FUNG|nr:hypothetical protein HK100_003998 [Physocladia obscura]
MPKIIVTLLFLSAMITRAAAAAACETKYSDDSFTTAAVVLDVTGGLCTASSPHTETAAGYPNEFYGMNCTATSCSDVAAATLPGPNNQVYLAAVSAYWALNVCTRLILGEWDIPIMWTYNPTNASYTLVRWIGVELDCRGNKSESLVSLKAGNCGSIFLFGSSLNGSVCVSLMNAGGTFPNSIVYGVSGAKAVFKDYFVWVAIAVACFVL